MKIGKLALRILAKVVKARECVVNGAFSNREPQCGTAGVQPIIKCSENSAIGYDRRTAVEFPRCLGAANSSAVEN